MAGLVGWEQATSTTHYLAGGGGGGCCEPCGNPLPTPGIEVEVTTPRTRLARWTLNPINSEEAGT